MILKELKIKTWIGDPTNCYILLEEESKEVMVIDPAGEVEKIEELIRHIRREIKIYLFNTLSWRSHFRSYATERKMWW